jgi:hypothetical protein
VVPAGRTPQHLARFVDLEPRLLQMLDHPRGYPLAGIVWRMLLEDPAQQIAATANGKADREGELVAKRAVIHRDALLKPSMTSG